MPASQNESGRAFEYGLAAALSVQLQSPIEQNGAVERARLCFEGRSLNEQQNISEAARVAGEFLIERDNTLVQCQCSIRIQTDRVGMSGDVRDIIVTNIVTNDLVGISAKHRHHALKHSRLSDSIDFGHDWLQEPCSSEYMNEIRPLFQELRDRQRNGELWRHISDKRARYYSPILLAFDREIRRLLATESEIRAGRLIHYLLGTSDFYKIIKENGVVSVSSFNIMGSLRWGNRIPLPTRIIEITRKPRSTTTLIMTLDNGWQVSFRIHSASTLVEPSLKFDINLVGVPSMLSRNEMNYSFR